MLDRWNPAGFLLVFGCLILASVVNADGRVFVLDLRNSSGPQGFRDAEQACAAQHARLASTEELRHAVLECYFSPCTRGWLYGGTVGTTVCNLVGGALKAVDVRTENATDDAAHLDAFCIKDKGASCGDPPSFPNARMQGHSEFEMGDELLYTCMPGYVMPNGNSVFSLLCDSCGEWYGLVQVCVKDKTESHVDYEDKFTDSYTEAEHNNSGPEEAHGEVSEEVHGAASPKGKRAQEQQETSLGFEDVVEHQDPHREQEVGEKVIEHGGKFEGSKEEAGGKDEEGADVFIGHPQWEQERKEVVKPAAATTDAPVSLLSQKHLFWFPSEAFQQEGQVSTNPAIQTTQRASGAQSEESKEQESQERQPHQLPVDDHDKDSFEEHDTNDQDDPDDSHHDDQDLHEDSHHDDQDDSDSRQGEDDHGDDSKHHIPSQENDRRGRYENHDEHYDHYDMGEHEDDHGRVRYGTREFEERDDTYDEHESYEDHEDVTDDHSDDDQEHPGSLEEHPDHDDHDDSEEPYDPREDSHDQDDLDDHEHHDHDDDHEHHDHDEHDDHDDHDSHDRHSHEDDDDDGHQHVIFSIDRDQHHNITEKGAGATATTDDTWLDGYPVTQEETGQSDSTTEKVKTEDRERGTVVRATDRPNEVEKPVPYTSFPDMPESPTNDSELDQGGVEEVWRGSLLTTAPSPDNSESSDSPSYSDTLDYDTQQAAPTHSWQGDLTEHPFLDHGPAPPMHDGNIVHGGMEEHTVHNLPGETGEREETEGEMGEAICTGEDCPPHPPSSYSRGPTVAAIIAVLCVLSAAVILGVWYYRRQQQKSSMYEMNGKGKSQTRQGQQIEMQQKV